MTGPKTIRFFKDVGGWTSELPMSLSLGYTIYNKNRQSMALFWPNDDLSFGEVIFHYAGGNKIERTDTYFPYNEQGLLQAVRYCYLKRQKPKQRWLRPILYRLFQKVASVSSGIVSLLRSEGLVSR